MRKRPTQQLHCIDDGKISLPFAPEMEDLLHGTRTEGFSGVDTLTIILVIKPLLSLLLLLLLLLLNNILPERRRDHECPQQFDQSSIAWWDDGVSMHPQKPCLLEGNGI